MCNAWNHPPGCDCGFGGDTGGGGWGGWGAVATAPVRTTWSYRDDDFCRPTTCPVCGASVFFVRHNGGSVWFDDLGWPWPKHACFDDDSTGSQLRASLTRFSTPSLPAVFGVVIETVASTPGEGGRIVVRCSDGTIIDERFKTPLDLRRIVGRLVRVERSDDGKIRLVFVDQPDRTDDDEA